MTIIGDVDMLDGFSITAHSIVSVLAIAALLVP